jgi:NTP pyrophosphatase (non-canonical NTP hydrolase)
MKIYNKLKKIAVHDDVTPERLLCKSTEELGELAEAINWFNNYKKTDKSHDEIIKACLEEGVDVMICVMTIFEKLGIDDNDINKMFDKKLLKYQNKLKKNNKIKIII